MGWLWASPSPQKPSTPVQNQSSSAQAPTSQSTTSAPNEPVDPEIQKFFELFSKDSGNSTQQNTASPSDASSAKPTDKPSSSWFSSLRTSSQEPTAPTTAPPQSEIAEALLPTEMSCRQAFDLAWQCNSIGGQWNAVYRYGSMRSCSEQWNDFWFCMRTKSYSAEMKERLIKEHYRNKEHAKYYTPGRPSSEDVWESRTEMVDSGTVFKEPLDAPKLDDDEWRRLESERRQKIRDGLGYNTSS
ncbi:Early meiotic induction protein 1 [Paramyrothecium foliicola]|nr:Early meiotic induction protein 1 [Paramyrothecium foliicola]